MTINLGLVTLGNSLGLYGLLALIPFIIIYLIRPKPQKVEIPSLMFLLHSKEAPKQQSFLRNFARDWLFLIQLLILLFLIFHLTQPFTTYSHDITAENTVVILDASGSMHAKEGSSTRFDIGKKAAVDALAGKNTIILAKSAPKIVSRDVDYKEAADMIGYLAPAYTPTALGEAIILAGEVLGGKEGRVVVISDFLSNEGIDPNSAKAVLEGKNLVVDFINPATKGKKDNAGIIALEVDEEITTVFVHNFNENQKTVTLNINDIRKELNLAPETTETYSFTTPDSVTKIELRPFDDLDVDNVAYISVPEKKKIKALLISNNASVFIKNALESSQEVEVDIAEPPIVPKGDYDLYVVHNVIPSQILPGTFEDIKKAVEDGASIVIGAQPELNQIDFKDLLPVTLDGVGGTAFIQVEQLNRFTKNIEFGGVDKFLYAKKKTSAVSIASAMNSTIITFSQFGKGKTFFYGIMEDANDFKLSPSYPIFWVKLVEFLVNQENIQNLNTKTGETMLLEDVATIKTPSQKIKQNAFIFDEVGIYEVEDRKIAANMLSEVESDITLRDMVGTSARKVELKPVKEERELSFEIPVIILIMALLVFELIFIKVRGDI